MARDRNVPNTSASFKLQAFASVRLVEQRRLKVTCRLSRADAELGGLKATRTQQYDCDRCRVSASEYVGNLVPGRMDSISADAFQISASPQICRILVVLGRTHDLPDRERMALTARSASVSSLMPQKSLL